MRMRQFLTALFFAMYIGVAALCMHSCSNDEDSIMDPPVMTRSDIMVASPEFQDFQSDMTNLAEKLRLSLEKMSESDKRELKEIAKKISDGKVENIEGLYDQMNSIIKIDLKSELNKIRENHSEQVNSLGITDVPRKELMTAMHKQSVLNYDIPLIKTRTESSGGLTPGEYDCVMACYRSWSYDSMLCAISLFASAPCEIIVTAKLIDCVDSCAGL